MYHNKSIILELGTEFYDPVQPTDFKEFKPRYMNEPLFEKIFGSQLLQNKTSFIKEHFHLFKPLPADSRGEKSLQQNLALRYHGYQFQHYNPDLGDGRGFLSAQVLHEGRIHDFGTKGSGTTPYSRKGDGRLTLKGAYREALATEFLKAKGVNTSQTFCFVETGEPLERNDEPSPTRASVLTRFSHSHLRFGTFERLVYLQQKENFGKLLHYLYRHYYSHLPHLQKSYDEKLSHLFLGDFFSEIVFRSADLTAQWMLAGFVHGVLNTDNMSLTGESFDYGPYRFLPHYDPTFTAAYFDHRGLYAYGRQPASVLWNLQRLADAWMWFRDSGVLVETGAQLKNPLDLDPQMNEFSDYFNFFIYYYYFKKMNIIPQDSRISSDFKTALTNNIKPEKNLIPQMMKDSSFNQYEKLLSLHFNFMKTSAINYEKPFFDLYGGLDLERTQKRISSQKDLYNKDGFKDLQNELKAYKTLKTDFLDPNSQEFQYFSNPDPQTLLYAEIESIWKEISDKDDWTLFNNKIQSFRQIF